MARVEEESATRIVLETVRSGADRLRVKLGGDWTIDRDLPSTDKVLGELGAGVRAVEFDTGALGRWDSGFLTFLLKVIQEAEQREIVVDREGLPAGVGKLLKLATAVPERKGARRAGVRESLLARIGAATLQVWRSFTELLEFLGEVTVACSRLVRGKARFRRSDLLYIIQKNGPEALPIVSLISLLVGLILAFVGAVQLVMFGAQIYVASLVGIAMVRVMGAIMTGIIMAGRTGAAFAAELGTMQVNEEIDALRTMGISPMEFLVLPRMIALSLMMPLLCLFADLMGVAGGFLVGIGVLGLSPAEYFVTTRDSVGLTNLWIGLFHSFVFGILVALTGCLQGIKAGRSASAVGKATTSAVVSGIISIVVATAIITVACNVLGI
ncbi:MAG: ABC transporter permease [Planctomycetota bacterium]